MSGFVKISLLLFLLVPSACRGQTTDKAADLPSQPVNAEPNSPEKILKDLNRTLTTLESYCCQVKYLVSQPLFESKTLRTGNLYYKKAGENSNLRINFKTLKQDDEPEQKYPQEYIFDGVWLIHIDYKFKKTKHYQQAEPNAPADVFELAGRNFPLIGFSKNQDLKKDFSIKLIEQDKNNTASLAHLHLTVKSDSPYKDDYISADFWIDKKLNLPAKIIAVSTEKDIYEIEFLNPKINKEIDNKLFEVVVPKDFDKPEIIPLQKNN